MKLKRMYIPVTIRKAVIVDDALIKNSELST